MGLQSTFILSSLKDKADSDAIIWRQGRVKEDYGRSLKKLKIIARSGTFR